MKRYISLFLLVFAGATVAAQELASAHINDDTEPTEVDKAVGYGTQSRNKISFEKKASRFGFIFGGSKDPVSNHDKYPNYNEVNAIGNLKIYYERFGMLGLSNEDAGVGFDVNLVQGYEWYGENTHGADWPEILYGSKVFVSGYAFRDFDLSNIITVGIMGGPSIVTNIVTTELDGSNYEGTAASLGIGIHTGQYILKYIGGKDKKKFCLRIGFEQYISINSGFTGLFGAGFGF